MIKQEKNTVKSELQKAFVNLLLQKSYMDITVTDLVNKAQVARMSFYRNFSSLDDVVESIADDIIQNFNTDFAPVIRDNSERKWRELLFEIVYHFIQVQKELGISIHEITKSNANNTVIISRIQEKMSQTKIEVPTQTVTEKYATVGKMNIIIGIIKKWSLSGMQETPEEIVNIIMSMIMKF